MTDDEFIARFEDASLPGELFHHYDHVKMAFLYLCRYPPLEALKRLSVSLVRFAAVKGKPELYNETVTWAFFLVIRERIARTGNGQSWEEFAAGNADLFSWKENVLRKYYRDETLSSQLARTTFVFPDKAIEQP
jgi:hypothetical protein